MKEKNKKNGKLEGPVQAFFLSNTFISNARLNLAKIQANAEQHSEILLFENHSHSSLSLSSK